MILERMKNIENNSIKYKLITEEEEQNKILGNINIYIPKFMHELWQNPHSISNIILKSDKISVKKIAHFIVHNLYDTSSLNHSDDQLIYIISLLLKQEINSLKEINSASIEENGCWYILNELKKKKEVQYFFKNIFLDIIKKLESKYSSENFEFDPSKINKLIIEENNNYNVDNFNDNKNDIKRKQISSKYIDKEININLLNKLLLEYENKEMKDFIKNKISEIQANSQLNLTYSNGQFLSSVLSTKNWEKTQNYYIQSFIQVIDIIDLFFENSLKYVDLLPYSIRCICKIITILIEKKFPEAIKVDKNKLLTKFFFQCLLFPIIINPSLNTFLSECMISETTSQKLKTLSKILNNLVFGKLFESNYLTPFNWYIIEKMPKLIEFFNKISHVSLPSFINKLINDELPEDFKYDYFKENPEENILYRNICFNAEELYFLISNAEKFKDFICIDKKIIEKLKFNLKKLEEIIINENEDYEEISNNKSFRKIIKYFLLTDSIYNDKFNNVLNIKNYKKKHFSLKELKIIEHEKQKNENNVIKVKNFICSLLYTYHNLYKDNFNKEKLSDVINIIKELKNHSLISSIYMDNSYIPHNWYINSLLQYLPLLPENYKKNDYELLLNELEKEIKDSIKELNFEDISKFIEYFKEIEKEKLYYTKIINIINDIDLNKKAQNIIMNEKFFIDLDLKENKLSQYFKELIKNEKEYQNLFIKEKKKIYNDIKQFIINFPNMNLSYEYNPENDIFQLIKKKKIPELIENYMILIKNNLKEKNIEKDNENNFEYIYNKIYDYLMEQLYIKLFPIEPSLIDIQIFQNCYKHLWIEFSNLFQGNKNYIFDNYLPDSINYFQKFENEKSPRKKLLFIKEIYNCIYNLGKFNGDEVEGADEELVLLNYTIIKSKPERLYSNCMFTECFLGEKKLRIEGNQLIKLLGLCEKMKTINYKDFFKISSEKEYKEKCKMAISLKEIIKDN